MDTRASLLLRDALTQHMRQHGTSLRKEAERLNISPAVLSHMANGRVPIPVDNAPMLAKAFDIPPGAMVAAVLQQRFPETVKEIDLSAAVAGSESQTNRLEFVLGKPLEDLTPDQQEVVREVVDSSSPRARWASVSEAPVLRLLREMRPTGISVSDYETIRAALTG